MCVLPLCFSLLVLSESYEKKREGGEGRRAFHTRSKKGGREREREREREGEGGRRQEHRRKKQEKERAQQPKRVREKKFPHRKQEGGREREGEREGGRRGENWKKETTKGERTGGRQKLRFSNSSDLPGGHPRAQSLQPLTFPTSMLARMFFRESRILVERILVKTCPSNSSTDLPFSYVVFY